MYKVSWRHNVSSLLLFSLLLGKTEIRKHISTHIHTEETETRAHTARKREKKTRNPNTKSYGNRSQKRWRKGNDGRINYPDDTTAAAKIRCASSHRTTNCTDNAHFMHTHTQHTARTLQIDIVISTNTCIAYQKKINNNGN